MEIVKDNIAHPSPIVSLEVIKAKFNLALTEAGFQALQTKADSIPVTEDNLQEVADFIKQVNGLLKVVDEKHKAGKEPHLLAGRMWDTAKNDFYKLINDIKNPVAQKYNQQCKEAERKRIEREAESFRIKRIKDGIESNTIDFSQRIAACETLDGLLAVERIINLEKGRKEKYGEFITEAVERFDSLNVILKTQKEKIRELEDLSKKELAAREVGDDEATLALMEKKEELQTAIEEVKINVQEAAINAATQPSNNAVATQLYPSVSARRTVWKAEIVWLPEVIKKDIGMLDIQLNSEAVKARIKTLQGSGVLKGKKEYILNGIKYFELKSY